MAAEEKGVYIYANVLDLNQDGKVDMISFVDPKGRGIAVAVDRYHDGTMDHIHVFQDVTGDGKLAKLPSCSSKPISWKARLNSSSRTPVTVELGTDQSMMREKRTFGRSLAGPTWQPSGGV